MRNERERAAGGREDIARIQEGRHLRELAHGLTVNLQTGTRDILWRLTEMPWNPLQADYLGQSLSPMDPNLVSSQEGEAKISLLIIALDRMLDHCEETMRPTGRTLWCWLRSTKPQACYAKPSILVALEASEKKYRQLFKRFLAPILRWPRALDGGENSRPGLEEEDGEEDEYEAGLYTKLRSALTWGLFNGDLSVALTVLTTK